MHYKKPLHKPSLIIGIVAIVSLWFTLGVSGIVLGIIGTIIARKKSSEYNSITGSVLSLIAIIISAVILIIVLMSLAIIFIMPDSIGAYYLQDLWEVILNKFRIGKV